MSGPRHGVAPDERAEIETYLLDVRKLKASSMNQYLKYIDTLMRCAGSEILSVRQLTDEHVTRWVETTRARGAMARTLLFLGSVARTLREFMLHQYGACALSVSKVRIRHERRTSVTRAPGGDIDKLLAAIDTSSLRGMRDDAMIRLMADASLRTNELSTLGILQISLTHRVVYRCRAGREAWVPFSEATAASILRYIREVRDHWCRTPASGVLFLGATNRGGLTRQAIWKIVVKHAVNAGLGDGVSPKNLRRDPHEGTGGDPYVVLVPDTDASGLVPRGESMWPTGASQEAVP